MLLDILAKILNASNSLHLLVNHVNRMMSVLPNSNVTKALVLNLAEILESFVLMTICATLI